MIIIYFSKEYIQKVKDATDLFELVKEYAPDLKYTTKKIAQCKCPNPNHNDSNPSFVVYRDTNTWNCYGCNSFKNKNNGGEGSDCIAFIQWINQGNLSWQDSIKYLANRAGIPLPNDENDYIYNNNNKKNLNYIKALKNNKEALNYLYKRGLNDYDITNWLIGYDSYYNRITFPLLDICKHIIGFNSRLIKDDINSNEIKYWHSSNSKIFNISKYLYGLHNINKKVEYIIITEGVIDVILATKYKVPNVVCTLGCKCFSDYQVDFIKKAGFIPIFIFDNDKAGIEGTERAIKMFIDKDVYCKVCILPDGKDLADLCLQCKSATRQYIEQNTYTYGYLQTKKIIDNYYKDLYELKLKIQPDLEKLINKIPINEKKAIENLLYNEIKIKL